MAKSVAVKKMIPPTQMPLPTATRLLLIRHGEVEARYQKKFGGFIDMDLSPNGKKQARILAEYLRGKTIDAIYASPMKRVQQTLAPTIKQRKMPQTILTGLKEIDFGKWSGLGWQEVEDQFGFKSHEWLQQIDRHGVPGGESGAVFRKRVAPCLQQIIQQHPGENVAVFCHGGVIRMILAILLKLKLPVTNQFDVEYASVTQVALHPHMNEVELLNFTPWRDLVG
ncbi:MAG TPA: histidine phosphatase family protein [Verrucomicrobiae bacterium]